MLKYLKYVTKDVITSKSMANAYAAFIALALVSAMISGKVIGAALLCGGAAAVYTLVWVLVFSLTTDARSGYAQQQSGIR